MIKTSFIYIITKSEENLFYNLNNIYNSLLSSTDFFELIVVNYSRLDNTQYEDVASFCYNRQYCKYKQAIGTDFGRALLSVLKYCECDTVILLNTTKDYISLDLDYILTNYNEIKYKSCFALYESLDINKKDLLGVVLKHSDLRVALKNTRTKSLNDFCLQCCFLYSHIGYLYYVNNKTSILRFYNFNLKVKGLSKLRLSRFLDRCTTSYII